MYKNSFKEGFNDAAEEYFEFRPVIKSVFENDIRDIFLISFYDFDKKYNSVRLNSFEKYDNSFYPNPWKTYKEYYDYSYENGSVANAPIDYKYSAATAAIIKKANTDGYNYFYDSCIYAYKENYPAEASFTTMPIIFVVIFIISLIAIILFFKWAVKSNRQKAINSEESKSDEETKIEISHKKTIKQDNIHKSIKPVRLTLDLSDTILLPEHAQSLIYPIGEEPEDLFRLRYTGVPISSFIKLPRNVKHIDRNGNIYFNSHREFGDYTVYIAEHGTVIHLDPLCANSYTHQSYFFLQLPQKYVDYPRCKKCFNYVPEIFFIDEWFLIYKKIILKKVEYNIDDIQIMNLDIFKLFSEEEANYISRTYFKRLIQKQKKDPTKDIKLSFSKPISKIVTTPFNEKNLNYKTYCIGKDISEGTIFFMPIKESEIALFKSNGKAQLINHKNQRFIFTKGETILVHNCYLSLEEFK